MGVSTATFISMAEQIALEDPSYRFGGDGSDGTCDCIGLIIGAIRRAGGSWRGTHGSNYAARSEMEYIRPFSVAAELAVGEVVYKAYEPGVGGYNLPAKYEKGGDGYTGDLRDYYHIGIVESVSPLRIRHMTTPRAKLDDKMGKWSYHGKLKKVDIGGDSATVNYQAKVKGGALNVRKSPSADAPRIDQIPDGTIISITEESGDWRKTTYKSITGWVNAFYLDKLDENTVTVDRQELEKIYDTLGDWLGLRG